MNYFRAKMYIANMEMFTLRSFLSESRIESTH